MLGVAALPAVRTACLLSGLHAPSCSRLPVHSPTLQLLGAAVTSEGCRQCSIKLTSPPHQAVGWQGRSVWVPPALHCAWPWEVLLRARPTDRSCGAGVNFDI